MKVLIRSLDLETSKVEPPGSIIEMGWTDMTFDSDTKEVSVGTPQNLLFKPIEPLEADNIAVHHLTTRRLAEWPVCQDQDIIDLCTQGDPQFLVAFNAAFEQKWMPPELSGPARWICPMKVALRIWPEAPAFNNQTLKYWRGLEDLPEELCMPPHRAGPDSYVTAHILAEMLKTERVSDMVGWTLAPRYFATCPLNRWKGLRADQMDHNSLNWIVTKATDVDPDIKAWAHGEIERRRAYHT